MLWILLLQDLVALKSLESFSLMECDEIHGEENVVAAYMDDFTVETSLEDLEFGFSITKSTEKVNKERIVNVKDCEHCGSVIMVQVLGCHL